MGARRDDGTGTPLLHIRHAPGVASSRSRSSSAAPSPSDASPFRRVLSFHATGLASSTVAKYFPTLRGMASACACAALAILANLLDVSPSLRSADMATAGGSRSANSLAANISACFTRRSSIAAARAGSNPGVSSVRDFFARRVDEKAFPKDASAATTAAARTPWRRTAAPHPLQPACESAASAKSAASDVARRCETSSSSSSAASSRHATNARRSGHPSNGRSPVDRSATVAVAVAVAVASTLVVASSADSDASRNSRNAGTAARRRTTPSAASRIDAGAGDGTWFR